MRATTELFKINGKPMLVPDADVSVNYEDLDSSDAGRDESGVMHRKLIRAKVASWKFSYAQLTEEEKRYMEGLFGDEETFAFTHPARLDSSVAEESQCYRSKYSIDWRNARTGLWSNYGFTVIQC